MATCCIIFFKFWEVIIFQSAEDLSQFSNLASYSLKLDVFFYFTNLYLFLDIILNIAKYLSIRINLRKHTKAEPSFKNTDCLRTALRKSCLRANATCKTLFNRISFFYAFHLIFGCREKEKSLELNNQ